MRINKIASKIFCVMLALAAVTSCSSTSVNNEVKANVNSSAGTANETASQGASASNIAATSTQTAAPEALVADLYKQHDAKKSPFFQNKDRSLIDKYFTKATADMIWKDATRPNTNEIGALGADPLYDGQDFEIKNFAVGKAEIKDKSAVVPVTFENFGEKKKINFVLSSVDNVWKIEDIKYPTNSALTQMYKEDSKSASKDSDKSLSGEFEGKYQIGDTTCTVTPVKMAFEVKWEKGSGTEIFFAKDQSGDKYAFTSDPAKGKANVFSFDDENYNTGTFYRADGRELPIKRVK